MRLTGVFNHGDAVVCSDGVYGVHVCRWAVKMTRDNGPCLGGYSFLKLRGIHGVRERINIHENRTRTCSIDGFCGGDKRVCYRDHFIAGANIESLQNEL